MVCRGERWRDALPPPGSPRLCRRKPFHTLNSWTPHSSYVRAHLRTSSVTLQVFRTKGRKKPEKTQDPFRPSLMGGRRRSQRSSETRICAEPLAEAEPLACCSESCLPSSPPPPLSLPHSLSPTSLHIVLLPISLSVINYKRHKPPGLMPRCGCLPSCTFPRAKRPASLITPGTLSGSPLAGRQRSPNGPFTVPKDTSAFFFSFFLFFSFSKSAEVAYFS